MQRGGISWSKDYAMASKMRGSQVYQATADTPTQGSQQAEFRPSQATSKHEINVNVKDWPHDATTVMLRNIPNRYTQEDLLEELTGKGFHAAFDYFHLVMDMRTKRNKGFAFLNLRSPALAHRVHQEFHGFHLHRYKSQKVLEVGLAEVQGLHANAITYLNAHGDRVQNVWFKPMIFVQAPGETPDWKAVPLIESNLPEDIARVYGSYSKGSTTRSEQRQRALTAVSQSDDQVVSDTDEMLEDGEYGEITSQVQAFLADCGGANKSREALLAALDKPRKRCKPKRGNRASELNVEDTEDMQQLHSNTTEVETIVDERKENKRAVSPNKKGQNKIPSGGIGQHTSKEVRTIEIASCLSASLFLSAIHEKPAFDGSSLYGMGPLAGFNAPLGISPPPGLYQ
jgi:RNA recognition motif-containing protein